MDINRDSVEYRKAEQDLYYWQTGRLGGFKTALWDAISKADGTNRARLAEAFPESVDVYVRFSTEEGYYDKVAQRLSVVA